MTLRLSIPAVAAFLLATQAAHASPPTNTDEVRAVAASRVSASPPRLTAAPSVVSTSTDEVRALVASLAPRSAPASTRTFAVASTNTDEVRAAFGREPAPLVLRSNAAAASAESARDAAPKKVACQQSCACHHG
jgi:hypothetical protein